MTPPRARTWGRRGHTHAGGASAGPLRRDVLLQAGRELPADLPAAPPPQAQGQGTRHLCLERLPRPGCPRSHPTPGAHRAELGHLNTHRAAGMGEYAAAHDWLTIIQLPSYAPDLNPAEGVWSLLRRGPLANTAFTDDEHLERTLRRGLRHIQLQPTPSTAAWPAPDCPSPSNRQQPEDVSSTPV